MSIGHIGAHLIHNKAARTVAIGATAGPATIAAGTALSTIGATSAGAAVTSVGSTLLTGAVSTVGGGAVATTAATILTAGATIVGTAIPVVAAGYGVYKFVKWLASD